MAVIDDGRKRYFDSMDELQRRFSLVRLQGVLAELEATRPSDYDERAQLVRENIAYLRQLLGVQ